MKYAPPALAATLLAASSLAQAAPLISVYGGGYSWDSELEGTIASGDDQIDMQDDLGFDESDQTVFYLGVEHAVPLLPNVRVRSLDLSDNATNRLERTFVFNGQVFVGNTEVETDLDLDILDGTLYYTPLDNAVKVNLGITVRKIEGSISLDSLLASTTQDFDETLPMLHASGRVSLPIPGVYVGGEVDTISYDGNTLRDLTARVGWRSDFLLGVELGYKHMDLELDDVSDLDADLDMGGPYLAASLSF
ncbi:MAG: TIGR04219 family outer membrane beta-barrel protein [Pseudomonadota bacterium]|nr:TIGR04219 family outer membrane beta-barrel protein [Pseudomonadota bacterium]